MKLFGWKAAREIARPVLARAGYAGGISRIGLGVIGGGGVEIWSMRWRSARCAWLPMRWRGCRFGWCRARRMARNPSPSCD